MNNKKYLETILPHKDTMLLLDDIVDYNINEHWLKSCVTIKDSNLFYDKDLKGIDSVIGIEYMAQTIGCYAYLKQQLKKPEIGFLLGTRVYNNLTKVFELGKTYCILVKEVFVTEVFAFECFIYNENNEEIASATVNVYQDIDEKIKEILNG